MQLPPWVPALVGVLVLVFGVYRIRLTFRSDKDDEAAKRRGGLYAFQRRTHLLFGIAYLLMGAFLLLGAFGVSVWPGSK